MKTIDNNSHLDVVYQALFVKGFSSATAFADSLPNTPLHELAPQLDSPAVSWLLLERALVDEAEAGGTLERCARDLLARDLRSELPLGWPGGAIDRDDEASSPLFRRAGVFLALAIALPEPYASAIDRVRKAMEHAEIATGWLPANADDPVLVATFAAHWSGPGTTAHDHDGAKRE